MRFELFASVFVLLVLVYIYRSSLGCETWAESESRSFFNMCVFLYVLLQLRNMGRWFATGSKWPTFPKSCRRPEFSSCILPTTACIVFQMPNFKAQVIAYIIIIINWDWEQLYEEVNRERAVFLHRTFFHVLPTKRRVFLHIRPKI